MKIYLGFLLKVLSGKKVFIYPNVAQEFFDNNIHLSD